MYCAVMIVPLSLAVESIILVSIPVCPLLKLVGYRKFTFKRHRFVPVIRQNPLAVLGDGLVKEGGTSDASVTYYNLGTVKAGESATLTENLKLDNYDSSGGWYSRSIQAYEYTGF